MKNEKFARLPLIALAALPLTVGLVFAQTTGATGANTAQAPQRVQPLQPGQQHGNRQQNQNATPRQQSGTNYSDVFIQKLAAGLGISVDKLRAAAASASKSTIDQGVKAGDFPADLAQNMTQRLQDNPFAFAGGRGGPGGPGGMRGAHGDDDFGRGGRGGEAQGQRGNQPGGHQPGNQNGNQQGERLGGPRGEVGQAINAAVAKALGLSEQQLMTELQGGKTIAQLAQSKGVSTAAIHTAAVSALKTQLAADVKAGRLSQAQADQMLQQAQADANFGLNFGRGGRGGDRGNTNGQTNPNQNG